MKLRMFEKNLVELIKGIRAHKGSEAKYIDSALAECKKEIQSKDLEIKAQGILKLAYVQNSLFSTNPNYPTDLIAANVWL
jgi:predicted GNAT family N-acyltransferase